MNRTTFKHLYGPVPSRRLGRSLGIDLVPYKVCSYDCIYCQLGSTSSTTSVRMEYIPNADILEELKQILATGITPDYISLAGSGEPTLHSRIGDLIRNIKAMTSIPVAVLTNGSLLWMQEVQEALLAADLVLPSLDAGDETVFQQVNRPDHTISFDRMVSGLIEFSKRFQGEIWLEVFLLAGLTDTECEVSKIAALAKRIHPTRVQLNSVYRPPAESYARGLTFEQLQPLTKLFSGTVEIISEASDYPAKEPAMYDTSRQDEILSLVSRRPCTANDIASGLGMHPNDVLKQIGLLISSGKLQPTSDNRGFYIVQQH